MNRKILISLVIIGILFVGSGVFAIFNGDLIFNDSSSSDLASVSTVHNLSDTVLKEIPSAEEKDLVTTDVSKPSAIINYQNLTKSDLLVAYVENQGVNREFAALQKLNPNSTNVTAGYFMCSECGLFVPVGNVLNLVPDEYLCKCTDIWFDSNSITPLYSEENILNFVYDDIYAVKNDPAKIINHYYIDNYNHIKSSAEYSNALNSATDGLNNTDSVVDKPINNDSKVVDSSDNDLKVVNSFNNNYGDKGIKKPDPKGFSDFYIEPYDIYDYRSEKVYTQDYYFELNSTPI